MSYPIAPKKDITVKSDDLCMMDPHSQGCNSNGATERFWSSWAFHCSWRHDTGKMLTPLASVHTNINIWRFPKMRALFWSPYNKNHNILGILFGPLIHRDSHGFGVYIGPRRPMSWSGPGCFAVLQFTPNLL